MTPFSQSFFRVVALVCMVAIGFGAGLLFVAAPDADFRDYASAGDPSVETAFDLLMVLAAAGFLAAALRSRPSDWRGGRCAGPRSEPCAQTLLALVVLVWWQDERTSFVAPFALVLPVDVALLLWLAGAAPPESDGGGHRRLAQNRLSCVNLT